MPLADTPAGSVLDLFRLDGQTALVTGGSRGIGASIAIALAQAGARIILAQRDTSNTDTQSAIRASGGVADIVPCDLGDRADAEKTFDRALAVKGVSQIDILVNNGGMLERTDSVEVTQDEWDRGSHSESSGVDMRGRPFDRYAHYYELADANQVLNINLHSLFILSQAAGRHFLPRQSGNIINIASLNSYIGGMRVAHYSAAKGAVATLTKALSNEWSGKGIRVNAIAPGSIATNINTVARSDPAFVQNRLTGIPGGRWGAPDDFAGPALFLASRASAYVTGEILVVDGGAMAKGPI